MPLEPLGRMIDLKQALRAMSTEPTTESVPILPRPLTRPYRFQDLGWQPLVNYIPKPENPPGSLTDPDLGWLD